jgi:hypothetical protein
MVNALRAQMAIVLLVLSQKGEGRSRFPITCKQTTIRC